MRLHFPTHVLITVASKVVLPLGLLLTSSLREINTTTLRVPQLLPLSSFDRVLYFLWQKVKPKLLALPRHHYSTMSTRLETPRWQGALPSLQGILLPSGVQTESLNKLCFVQMDFFNHYWILGLDNKFHMKQNMEESIVSSTGQNGNQMRSGQQ